MLLHIPQVLDAEVTQRCRELLAAASWVDGLATAGYQGAQVKKNQQLDERNSIAHKIGDLILSTLERHPLFISATLPAIVYPPLFNRYTGGQHFGNHIDNAVRLLPGSAKKIRTDISATLFFSEPDEYDGGELIIEDTYSAQSIKLNAGDMVVYPATSVHRVNPVTKGTRVASFFWIQSLIRDDTQRRILFDMDTAIQRLNQTEADHQSCVQLTGCYHNLLRQWAET